MPIERMVIDLQCHSRSQVLIDFTPPLPEGTTINTTFQSIGGDPIRVWSVKEKGTTQVHDPQEG
jgi:hypothetical protein